jgi:hypothetical protein
MPVSNRTSPNYTNKQTLRLESASELYRPNDRRLSANLEPTLRIEGVAWPVQRIPTAVISPEDITLGNHCCLSLNSDIILTAYLKGNLAFLVIVAALGTIRFLCQSLCKCESRSRHKREL